MRDSPTSAVLGRGIRHSGRVSFEPTPPLFVIDDDTYAFSCVTAMTQYVEPWDVWPTTRAYDADGRTVALRSSGVQRTKRTVWGGETYVDFDASGEDGSEELLEHLRAYLHRVGPHVRPASTDEINSAPLSVLVQWVWTLAKAR